MNLYSVSWEVIHMTSQTIRGLVPNLSGDNRGISSSPPFSFLPPPWETAHQKHGHLSMWSWTRSQPNWTCVYVHSFCVHVCPFVRIHHKDKGRRGAAQPSLIPEEPSVRAGSDPGGRPWSCGAHTHPGMVLGSIVVPKEPAEWLDSLGML